MKLELKHLAPYLPYGLKCKYVDEDKLYTLDAEITETNQDKRLLQLFHVLENPSSCKIILHPLSDLTRKDIEAQGFWYHIDYLTHEKQNPLEAPFHMVQYLLSNHYDIFDLIPEGLAIDINTLQS